MNKLTNSRFITFPSIEEKSSNHTVIFVDTDKEYIEEINKFCQTSLKDYDVYLHNSLNDSIDWFEVCESKADMILVNKSTIFGKYKKFGEGCTYTTPVDYLKEIDKQP